MLPCRFAGARPACPPHRRLVHSNSPCPAHYPSLITTTPSARRRATSDTPTQIKNILTSSGDPYLGNNGASFISMRRLNAAKAVEAALVLARTNRTGEGRAMARGRG